MPDRGCGATLNGEFWYFGGIHANYRQVSLKRIFLRSNDIFKASKMVGCDLVRQFNMPFELYKGACNTFKTPKEKVLMCFDAHHGRKRCDRSVKLTN